MKSLKILFLLSAAFLLIFSCSVDTASVMQDEVNIDNELNNELAKMMDLYSKALTSDDSSTIIEFEKMLAEFDEKYNSALKEDFDLTKQDLIVKSGGNSDFEPLTDLPIETDGAVYLSGGKGDKISAVISYIAPTVTPGGFYHGGVLDYNKFDPTNMESQCFQTAVTKGAGYETPMNWMKKANVAVLNPAVYINPSSLDQAQSNMHYYCRPENTNMKYGFFKNYVNLFSLVEKKDNYHWYCTKVIWRVFDQVGVDVDSNSKLIDWRKSGLMKAVKAYYYSRYWYNRSKAKRKIKKYIENATKTIVLAEEIYFSPKVTKVYEVVRQIIN